MNSSKDKLIEFPCEFPIKVMGIANEKFAQEILTAVRFYAPDTNENQITLKSSSGGRYLSATVKVHVFSQEQLDSIYRVLTSHEMVKVVL